MSEIPNSLPPGWDCKYDPRTSRYYFINHYTKVTTWDDPRLKYRQIHGTPTNIPSHPVEHIPLQHGSPEFRRNYVYPSQTCPQPAFQMPKSVPVQDLSNLRMSPAQTSRGSVSTVNKNNISNGPHHPLVSQAVSRMQETNLTQVPADTEQSVSKISTMFPTVTETHIRMLMKKYYNREAVVISALQVEKYPITTPGPYTTPPPSRNFSAPAGTTQAPLHMTPPPGVRSAVSRTGSPIARQGSAVGSPLIGDYRSSPKPHSSPKMKLRYMKSIFPQVEETVLLDVLGNNENNVQKASEALKGMGFEKREMKLPKSKKIEPKPVEQPKAAPKILTTEEKISMKIVLQEKYKEIPERVIIIALESVDYNKSRAIQILDIVKQEESSSSKTSSESSKRDENKIEESSPSDLLKKSKSALITPSPSIHALQLDSKNRRTKEKKNSTREPLQENNSPSENTYRSSYLIKSSGPNSTLVKGSDNGMLLEDYVSWDGPDPTLREGCKNGLAKGPNRSLLLQRSYQPCGPNSENRKGPALGLAKGSIYSQMKTLVVGESRGK